MPAVVIVTGDAVLDDSLLDRRVRVEPVTGTQTLSMAA